MRLMHFISFNTHCTLCDRSCYTQVTTEKKPWGWQRDDIFCPYLNSFCYTTLFTLFCHYLKTMKTNIYFISPWKPVLKSCFNKSASAIQQGKGKKIFSKLHTCSIVYNKIIMYFLCMDANKHLAFNYITAAYHYFICPAFCLWMDFCIHLLSRIQFY